MENTELAKRISEARDLARSEFVELFQFVAEIAPELRPDEVMVLTGFLLHQLRELLTENPSLMNQFKAMTDYIKQIREN